MVDRQFIVMRRLLAFLIIAFAGHVHACENMQLVICNDSAHWENRLNIWPSRDYCGHSYETISDGRTCMKVGNPPATPPANCPPAGTSTGGPGAYTSFSISGPSADLPTTVCIDGCSYNLGPLGSGVKSQNSAGGWVAGFHTPFRNATGQACEQSAPGIPEADKDEETCPLGYVKSGTECVKSQADQQDDPPKTTETQNPDGTKTVKERRSSTKCTATHCTTTTTETTTNYHDGQPVGPSTTTTTTTTQPRGGTSPAPGTPHGSGSGSGTGGGTGGTGGGSGSVNGGGTTDGSGYCEENPGSPLCGGDDHCEKYPNTLACLKKGDPGTLEAKPVTNKNVDVSSITPRSGFGPSTGSCPAGTTINVNGTSITIGFDMICQFADMIRPLVIGFAWLSAAFSFFGFARRD